MKHFTSPEFWELFAELRALGTGVAGGILWGWIGSHADYDKLLG